jgi:undecaprenyl diphosphate synthase
MVNLISNEPKTGCYLLPILSNPQAPIFKINTLAPAGPEAQPVRPFPLGPLRPLLTTPTPLLAPPLELLNPHLHFLSRCWLLTSLTWSVKLLGMLPSLWTATGGGHDIGWPRSRGHLEGAKAVRECVEACLELGIEYLTLYAFSTENWQRPKEEVDTLMGLLQRFLRDYTKDMAKRGVRVQAIGRLNELPPECQDQLEHAITTTANNKQLTAILAVNYSGRTEIIDAIQRLAKEVATGKLQPDAIDAELFSSFLYTRHLPDPDLLIRTSGEMRISNFLLWQVSYTEMYVIPKLWPDFSRQDLVDAIDEYNRRQRRYGGV